MKAEKVLPPAQVEAMRQMAYAREFELAWVQRRRIFFAKFNRLQRRPKRVARKS